MDKGAAGEMGSALASTERLERETGEAMRLDIDGCARCGQEHRNIEAKQFEDPPKIGGVTFTHWVMCPNSQDPILLVRSA
jgi:hypothetical protein